MRRTVGCVALAILVLAGAVPAQAGDRSKLDFVPRDENGYDVYEVVGSGFPAGQEVRIEITYRESGAIALFFVTPTDAGELSGVFLGKSEEGNYGPVTPGRWRARATAPGASAKARLTVPDRRGEPLYGQWGGEHITLDLQPDSGKVEYNCAHGFLEGPVIPDGRGNFLAMGTHVREGGPASDEPRERRSVRYDGRVEGTTMTLTVTLLDTGEVMSTFVLEKDKASHLFKCL